MLGGSQQIGNRQWLGSAETELMHQSSRVGRDVMESGDQA